MFPLSNIVFVLLFALMSWIQPCPAPQLIVVAVEATTEAVVGGVVGGVVEGTIAGVAPGGVEGVVTGAIGAGLRSVRRDSGIASRGRNSRRYLDQNPSLSACMIDHVNGPKPLMTIHSDHTVDISGVPASCIQNIVEYNSHPNITDLQAVHGSTVVVGSDAVHLFGIPEIAYSYLDKIAGAS